MSEQQSKPPSDATERNDGFFINAGTHSGWFTTPDGDVYDIRKLEPREVTDGRSGEVATIWGGYATARDRDLAARDAMLQAEFKANGKRPAELFDERSKDIPLYVTLRHRPGKGYTDIGSFWNARSRYTVLASDRQGKNGLRFGGHVLPWLSAEKLAEQRAARANQAAPATEAKPDAAAAREGAKVRARKAGEPKAPQPEQT